MQENIKLIGELSKRIWGNHCELGELKALSSPYPEFELPMRLYEKISVVLTYDRSILGIDVKTQNGNVWVDGLTDQMIYDGFESCKPENLLHNFRVLDEAAREMMVRGQE